MNGGGPEEKRPAPAAEAGELERAAADALRRGDLAAARAAVEVLFTVEPGRPLSFLYYKKALGLEGGTTDLRLWAAQPAALRAASAYAQGAPLGRSKTRVRLPGGDLRAPGLYEDARLRALALVESLGLWENGRRLDAVMRLNHLTRWVHATTPPSRGDIKPFHVARRDLDRCLLLRPEDGQAWALRGLVLFRMRQEEEEVLEPDGSLRPDAGPGEAETFRRETLTAAAASFESALRLDPGCTPALKGRGELRLAADRFDEAARDLQAALDREPQDAWAWVLLGEAEHRRRALPRALAALDRALELDPRLAWAYVARSEALRETARFDEALADLDRVVALDPCPWAYALRARTRFNFRDQKGGLADLDRALALAPDFPEAYAYRGEAYRRQGRLEEGLRDLDRALALAPEFSRCFAWRGSLKRAMGRFEEAIEDQRRALALSPEYVFSYVECAQAQRKLGRYGEAVRSMNAAARLDPKSGWIFGEPGAAGATVDSLPEVEADLTRAADGAPDAEAKAWALAWRGETRLRAGRLDEAAADLEQALALQKLPWARAWRGLALCQKGDFDAGLADLNAAAAAEPGYANAHGWRGGELRRRGRFAEAVAALSRCLELNPGCTWAFAWRGEARLQTGDLEGAVADLERAASLQQSYADAHAWLGEAYRRLGRFALAESSLTRALELGPHNHPLWQVYVSRGLSRKDLGRLKESVEDLEKARSLAPELFAAGGAS